MTPTRLNQPIGRPFVLVTIGYPLANSWPHCATIGHPLVTLGPTVGQCVTVVTLCHPRPSLDTLGPTLRGTVGHPFIIRLDFTDAAEH